MPRFVTLLILPPLLLLLMMMIMMIMMILVTVFTLLHHDGYFVVGFYSTSHSQGLHWPSVTLPPNNLPLKMAASIYISATLLLR